MIDSSHDTVALKCICHVYSPSQAALKISALEGHGFEVFAPWFHTIANNGHMSIALGGLPILVPHRQAPAAMALLEDIETVDEVARAESGVRRSLQQSLLWRLISVFVFWFTGTGPAMNVAFLTSAPAGRSE